MDERIRQQQGRVAALEAEIASERSSTAAGQSLEASRAAQKSAVSSQELSELREEIAAQERVVGEHERRLMDTVAPDPSDIINQRRQDLAREQAHLTALRSRYADALARANASVEESHTARRSELEAEQAGQVEMSVDLAEARAELDRLKKERERLAREANPRPSQ